MDLKNLIIEYHILQSFPVTCLNRDDVGAPKSAIVGGVPRARVSSQCWKRAVRLSLRDLGVKLGTRTKHASTLFAKACVDHGATEEQAAECGSKMASVLAEDTLLFISESEAEGFAAYAESVGFDASAIKDKDLTKVAKKSLDPAVDALDIALFGRMVAKAAGMNVEGAASFNHAISTHKVTNELEFFTAMDDMATEPGSSHMGTLEFNSATYYRYVSLNVGELARTMDNTQIAKAIASFTQALFLAVPGARQATQSGASPWDFARVYVRDGQRLQVPFEEPIKTQGGGYTTASRLAMVDWLDKKEAMFGSMFRKKGCYDWGDDPSYSLDNLVESLQSHV